jgi:hypothetical protein
MEYDPKAWTSMDLICQGWRMVFKWHSDCHVITELPLTECLPPFNFSGGMKGLNLIKSIKPKSEVIVSALGGIAVSNGDKREYYRGEFLPKLTALSRADGELPTCPVVELHGRGSETVARLAHAMGDGRNFNHIGLHGLLWRKHEDGNVDLVATDRMRLAVHNPSYSNVASQYLLPRELIEQALKLADGGYLTPKVMVNEQGESLRAEITVGEYRIWQPSADALTINLFGLIDIHCPHEIVRLRLADMKAIAKLKSKTGYRFYVERDNLTVYDGRNMEIQDAVFYAESVVEMNFRIDAVYWREFVDSLPYYPNDYLIALEIHNANGQSRLVWRDNNEARMVLLESR